MAEDYQIDIQVDEEFSGLVDEQNIIAAVAELLRQAGKSSAALTIAITDDAYIQQLNQEYRDVDAPTDVLSFPSQSTDPTVDATLALPPELVAELENYLGDLVIAYPYTVAQAAHYQNSVPSELRLLAVHGVLHLLGYDHATPEEEDAMWAAQERALAALGDQGLSQRTYDA
ncbi:MAG: rRNA maturation RNase YbeY [Chloroflexi bacterium]|nr:rRNA maturation RNase YbeY [Chloroflexota bacterium]